MADVRGLQRGRDHLIELIRRRSAICFSSVVRAHLLVFCVTLAACRPSSTPPAEPDVPNVGAFAGPCRALLDLPEIQIRTSPDGGTRSERVFGSPDVVTTFAYGEDGRLLTESRARLRGGATQQTTYEYDSSGHRIAELVDTDDDGHPDRITRLEVDSTGRTMLREWDRDGDATPDAIYRFEYDDAGWLVTEWRDLDADGAPDERHNYTNDDAGNVLAVEVDRGLDGMIDARQEYAWSDENRLLVRENDDDADGTADARARFVYDSAGHLVAAEHDSDADGTIDGLTRYTVDEPGNVLAEERYPEGPRGPLEQRTTFEYDCW